MDKRKFNFKEDDSSIKADNIVKLSQIITIGALKTMRKIKV